MKKRIAGLFVVLVVFVLISIPFLRDINLSPLSEEQTLWNLCGNQLAGRPLVYDGLICE